MMRRMAMVLAAVWLAGAAGAQTKRAAAPQRPAGCISRDPYIGAMVVDAETGQVLFEERARVPGYPASTLKLMTLLVIQEKIDAGEIRVGDMVKVSVEAYKTGGSQVYLDPRETFSVEDMLYALMIQSANDAAVALAEHVSGSVAAFVTLMNERAAAIGMKDTRFASPHGLPPDKGRPHDVTTAYDLMVLSRELCKHPAVFAYTSETLRVLRADTKPFEMRTHNPFLKEKMPGCDGFKTGYTSVAGWSIVVTCKRNGRRVIVVVLGSESRKLRDAKARELLDLAFGKAPAPAAAAAAAPAAPVATGAERKPAVPPPPPMR